ncbi:MAG: GFA family protein [bacterium]
MSEALSDDGIRDDGIHGNDIRGGCICGAIRYRCDAAPEFSILCQCRQCQRITGAGHAASFAVAAAATTISGRLRFHAQTADSGNTVRSGFCADCGAPVMKTTTKLPRTLFFHAATLDDPSRFKPQMVVYADAKQPWDHVDPKLPRR